MLYLIWSHEHSAWWGPDGCGYTRMIGKAGLYGREEALLICLRSIPGTGDGLGAFPELPVRLDDMKAVIDRMFSQREWSMLQGTQDEEAPP